MKDDHELWQAFSSSTLPERAWTHREHLRVAWMFLKGHALDEAHILMRVGIIRLNAFHGLVETPSRGYHETITRVWLTLIHHLMKEIQAETSADFVDRCGERLSREALFRHYDRDRILSAQARAIFVEPDREPLPPA